MSKESYIKGFCKTAAAHGVDPKALAKIAESTTNMDSTPVTDTLAGVPASLILGATPITAPLVAPINTVGNLFGLFAADRQTKKEKLPWISFAPGISSYRIGRRIRSQVLKELDDIKNKKEHSKARPVAHAVAEHLGTGTSTLAAGALGALLGAGAHKDSVKGALLGSMTGLGTAGLANTIGAIAAAVKRRRTAKEQIESDKNSVLAKYLVPGIAGYDFYKRLGRSQGDIEENEDNKKGKGK